MLSRWKNAIVGRPPQSRAARAPAPLPDLADVPPLHAGAAGGLAAVDPTVMSHYLRRPVRVVQPLLSAPYSSDGGDPAVHGPTVADPTHHGPDPDGAGDPAPPHLDDRVLDASGWRIHFEDGLSADVRLQPVGVVGSAFPDLQARFYSQQDQPGAGATSPDRITTGAVGCVAGSPYETYYQGTILVSRGSRHEAVVEASSLASPHFREAMAGIAVLALRLIAE